MRGWFFCGMMLWGLASGLLAQDDAIRIRGTNPNYRQGDWISYSVTRFVTSVAVGNQYIYFGTIGGITRFDQYSRKWDYPFTTSNGLADNNVTAVAFDISTSFLWCATTLAVSYYNPSSQQWSNIFKDEVGIPKFDDIVSVGFGADNVYVETRGGRLFAGTKFGGNLLSTSGFGSDVGKIAWFGLRTQRDRNLPLFFMSDGYLFNLDGYVQDFRLRRADITEYASDNWGYMWFGTWGFGAMTGEMRSQRLDLLPFGLYNRSASALVLDRNGLWIGGTSVEVDRSGLTYWDQVRQRWVYYEARFISDFTSDDINRLVVDGDTLYCATRYGLSIYDTAHNRWRRITTFDGLEKENVNAVCVDGNTVWVGSDGGLNRIDRRTIGTDSLDVTEIAADDLHLVRIFDVHKYENLLWVATEIGLYIFDTAIDSGGFLDDANGPVGQVVTCISQYGNEIWFGSLRSIDVFDVATKEWQLAPARNLSVGNPVRAIVADAKSVWAGTDGGVLKFNRKNREWLKFTREDGLIDDRVYAIQRDGDYIWFGTPSGVTVYYWNDPRRID